MVLKGQIGWSRLAAPCQESHVHIAEPHEAGAGAVLLSVGIHDWDVMGSSSLLSDDQEIQEVLKSGSVTIGHDYVRISDRSQGWNVNDSHEVEDFLGVGRWPSETVMRYPIFTKPWYHQQLINNWSTTDQPIPRLVLTNYWSFDQRWFVKNQLLKTHQAIVWLSGKTFAGQYSLIWKNMRAV